MANDALADASLPAANGGGDLDIGISAFDLERVFIQRDFAQGGIDQGLGAISFLVGIVEEFGLDPSAFIRDEDTGEGDTEEHGIVARDFGIQDLIITNDLGVDIREQRIRDLLFFCEFLQSRLVIV